MLYQTFTNTVLVPPGTPNVSPPVQYDLGLTAYTPPPIQGNWAGLGGLGTMRSILFPYDNGHAWDCVDIPFGGRISLYASILQTTPANQQVSGTYPTTIDQSGSTPEESFLAAWLAAGEPPTGISYWRVLGSIIVEFDESDEVTA
jgi:hypothetical protein